MSAPGTPERQNSKFILEEVIASLDPSNVVTSKLKEELEYLNSITEKVMQQEEKSLSPIYRVDSKFESNISNLLDASFNPIIDFRLGIIIVTVSSHTDLKELLMAYHLNELPKIEEDKKDYFDDLFITSGTGVHFSRQNYVNVNEKAIPKKYIPKLRRLAKKHKLHYAHI